MTIFHLLELTKSIVHRKFILLCRSSNLRYDFAGFGTVTDVDLPPYRRGFAFLSIQSEKVSGISDMNNQKIEGLWFLSQLLTESSLFSLPFSFCQDVVFV